jgi:hypothetical protein
MASVPLPATAIMMGRKICTSIGRNIVRATGEHKKSSEQVPNHAGDLSRATKIEDNGVFYYKERVMKFWSGFVKFSKC